MPNLCLSKYTSLYLFVERRWRRLLALLFVLQVVVPLQVVIPAGLVRVPLERVERVVDAAAVVRRGLLEEARVDGLEVGRLQGEDVIGSTSVLSFVAWCIV